MIYRVTVELILDVDSEAEAFDGTNEILRGQQRDFSAGSCLLDYAIPSLIVDERVNPNGYQEGDAFNSRTWS